MNDGSHPWNLTIRRGALLGACAVFMALHALPWVSTTAGVWFYPIVWWSFIGILEWFHVERGRAVFVGTDESLPRVAGFSMVLWFVFEVYNLYLGNWYYVGVPSSRCLRWLGTAVSFATVLPGMWVVKRLVVDGLPGSLEDRIGLSIGEGWRRCLLILGLIWTIGPFLYPDVMFPFVWGGLLLVADGIASRMGGRSFIDQLGKGSYRNFFAWLIAGAICGILWEFWNHLAAAGWIYTVPGMGAWRLFEMPLLGYLGFPPFALMAWRLFTLWDDWFPRSRPIITSLTLLGSLVFCLMTLWAMDQYTFVSTEVRPSEFVGWSDTQRRRLRSHDDTFPAARRSLTGESARQKLELLSHGRMGTELANCLWQNDVRSVGDISSTNTRQLASILRDCRGGPHRFWIRRVKDWKQRD